MEDIVAAHTFDSLEKCGVSDILHGRDCMRCHTSILMRSIASSLGGELRDESWRKKNCRRLGTLYPDTMRGSLSRK